MIRKNKILKTGISIFILLLFSLIVSFLSTNLKIMINTEKSERKDNIIDLNKANLNLFEFDNQKLISTAMQYPSIEFQYNEKYIDKLIFNYEASGDYSWSINVEGIDSYGKNTTQTLKGAASSKINIFSEKIDMKVNKIKISFDGPISEVSNIVVRNNINFNKHIFVFIFLSTILLYCLYQYRIYFSKNIEKAFLLIAMLSGILLIYSTPKLTFISWDDETHFSRAYSLFQYPTVKWTDSTNQMRTPIPFNIERINSNEEYEIVSYYFNISHNYDNAIIEDSGSAFIEYQRYAYIPSAIGLSIGRILNVPFSILLSMGKLFNLLFYCFVTYFAIKIIPYCKKILTVIALLPSSIWLATQYSCDTIITSCIFLSISILLYEFYNKNEKLSLKNAILFILPILYASFAKAVYIPLILLILLLPKEKFGSKKEKIIFKLGVIGLFVLVMSTFVLPTIADPNYITDTRSSGANTSEQLHLVLKHPFSFLEVLYQNAGRHFLESFFSKNTFLNFAYMGEINSPSMQYAVLMILMFFAITDQTSKKLLDNKTKIFTVLVLLSIIAMIWSSMYLAFTSVGSSSIQGVQYRYFIPLVFPLLLCFNTCKLKNGINEIKYTQFLYYSTSVIMLLCIYLNVIKVIYN